MRSVVYLLLLATLAGAADIPKTLISEDEAEPIRSAISRKESWTLDDVRRLRAEADRKLKEGPWSVTSDRPDLDDLDPHEYYSEAPNWWPNPDNPSGPFIRKDGQVNPNRFIANKTALNAMSDAVFTLGSAAFLLDDARYAHRAARIIQIWFLNPRSRMNPNLDHSQVIPGITARSGAGAGILEGRVFIRAIQGMEFLAQTGAWDAKDQAAMRKWFEEYLRWLTRSNAGHDEKGSGNNRASWWTAQVAAIASFVDDKPIQQMAFDYYRERLFPRQIKANGSAPREEARAHSLYYSVFNLEAFTTICRIAQVQGVNLWTVRARNGATLATVIDYLQPYLSDPRKWNKEQNSEIPNDSLYFLAFAGMGMHKPEYVELFRKLERPDNAWLNVVDLLVLRWESASHQTRH